jgi:glutamyl-tRNA synthetase
VATLPGAEILDRVLPWADSYDPDLAGVLRAERDLALRALAVEREGADNPRKDLRRWAEFRPVYGFFFPEIFEPVTDPADPRFGGLDPDLVRAIASGFADGYQSLDPGPAWFEQVRQLSAKLGFAPSNKEYKKNRDAYPGSIADVSQVIRVLLTGSRRSPDLGEVCAAIGEPEVLRRARALS